MNLLVRIILVLGILGMSNVLKGAEIKDKIRQIAKVESNYSDSYVNLLLVIAQTETGIQQINSRLDKDIGIFQIYYKEIEREGWDKEALESQVGYQIYIASKIIRRKYMECKKRYDLTWIACYNSATPSFHNRYWLKLKQSARYLKIDLMKELKVVDKRLASSLH